MQLDLPLVFAVLMGLAMLAYVILDGFDLGVGILLPFAARTEQDVMVSSIGPFQARALRWSQRALLLTAAGVAAISLATPFVSTNVFGRWFVWPNIVLLAPLPTATAAAFVGIWLAVSRLQRHETPREWVPFALAVLIFVLAFAGLAYSLFPYLIVDRMTIWQAAAARESLSFIFVGTCVVLPMIVAYTVFAYRVFWGKARELTYGDSRI